MMKKLVILCFFLAAVPGKVTSQTLDQSQLNFGTPIMTRHLGSGYSIFQYFTAGITGTLVEIDLGIADSINGTASLRIYSGMDTTGGFLQAFPVTAFCQGGPCLVRMMVSVPVVSGQAYTFRVIPGAGFPDPYFLQGENPGTYSGGRMGYINPYTMGYTTSNPDLVFKTYVLENPTAVSEYKGPLFSFEIFPNPSNDLISIRWKNQEVTELSITDVLGKTVRELSLSQGEKSTGINGLQKGLYFVRLKNSEQQQSAPQKIIIN